MLRVPPADPSPPVSERAVLLAVGLGTTVAPLNSTMIAVALPPRSRVPSQSWSPTGSVPADAVLALEPVEA